MHRSVFLLVVALACGGTLPADTASTDDDAADGTQTSDGSSSDGADGQGGSDGSDGSDGGAPVDAPVVTAGDAWCYQHDTGEVAFLWKVEIAYSDPQGLDTINTFFEDGIRVTTGGTEVARYALTCSAASGSCSGGFNQVSDGVSCTNATAYTLSIQVVDEDENWSAPLVLTGRQGSGPTG